MIMKALPTQYKAFTAVINQKEDDLTFPDFKILLRNYEDQEKIHSGSESTSPSVMSIMSTNPHYPKTFQLVLILQNEITQLKSVLQEATGPEF